MIKIVIAACFCLASCATSGLDRHIQKQTAALNRGDFPVPMVKHGEVIECNYIGIRTEIIQQHNNDGSFTDRNYQYRCYYTKINNKDYYLNIPIEGRIWVIENNRPITVPDNASPDKLLIKFTSGGGSSTTDKSVNKSLLGYDKYYAAVKMFENMNSDDLYFKKKSYWGDGPHDVLAKDIYVSEGDIVFNNNGEYQFASLALNIDGYHTSRYLNYGKYTFVIVTVPFDILTFPIQLLMMFGAQVDH